MNPQLTSKDLNPSPGCYWRNFPSSPSIEYYGSLHFSDSKSTGTLGPTITSVFYQCSTCNRIVRTKGIGKQEEKVVEGATQDDCCIHGRSRKSTKSRPYLAFFCYEQPYNPGAVFNKASWVLQLYWNQGKLNGRELSQVLEKASEADAFAASTSSSNKKGRGYNLNMSWAHTSVVRFFYYQKKDNDRKEIAGSTVRGYYKAIKLVMEIPLLRPTLLTLDSKLSCLAFLATSLPIHTLLASSLCAWHYFIYF